MKDMGFLRHVKELEWQTNLLLYEDDDQRIGKNKSVKIFFDSRLALQSYIKENYINLDHL